MINLSSIEFLKNQVRNWNPCGLIIFCLGLFLLISPVDSFSAATGDYRSSATGNWNARSSWEKYNGAAWVAATDTPTSVNGAILILNGHNITVTVNVSVDEVTVSAGGTLTVAAGKNLTIANGTGTDLSVDGTVIMNGILTISNSSAMVLAGLAELKNGGQNNYGAGSSLTINNGGRYRREDQSITLTAGIITVNSGGVFQHNMDGQNLPLATWNSGSLCEITGVTGNKPGNLDQTFHSFTWNCPNQTGVENLAGDLTNVDGDLTFVSTGTGTVRFGQGENYDLTVVGNFNLQGGTVYGTTKSQLCVITVRGNYIQSGGTFAGTDVTKDDGEGSPTINVEGNFSISSGTFDFSQYDKNSAGKGITTLNLYGNYSQSGGTVTETATQTGRGDFNFVKTGTQYYTKTSGTLNNTINFVVDFGSITDLGNSVVTSAGTFTLSSGGGLNMGSADGITQTAALGNVQVTGTRSYNTNAYYTYNGSVAQVTGNGLPSTVNTLTVDNSNHVSLTNTVSVSNTLYFTSGNFITPNDTLIVGTGTAVPGAITRTSGHVVGYLKRWVRATATSNILFPVGATNFYEGMNISFTVAPTTAGSITATYETTNPGKSGFNLYDNPDSIVNVGYGLWTTTTGNGFAGGTYTLDITATAMPGVTDYTSLRIIKRTNSGSVWTLSGTHSAGTGSNAVPIVHRTGLTTHGQFAIGAGASNVLPIELIYFRAKLFDDEVMLEWSTASEINNDYFTIEHSTDGMHFEAIKKISGAGNSTSILYYSATDYPLMGDNFYRLKQTDFDGNFSYSDVETIKYCGSHHENEFLLITSISPNPFDITFKINFSYCCNEDINFMLLNSSGQVVSNDWIRANEGLNTFEFCEKRKLMPGIYLVNLIGSGQKISGKVIKN